jgi:hypothetical protein
MKHRPLPPLEELKEFLDYNPDTGIFTWKKTTNERIKIGQEAGTTCRYRRIRINTKSYPAHRLAYYMYHGVDPLESEVDHIDGNYYNNKIDNLRLATHLENQRNRKLQINSTSGRTGVSWYETYQAWVSYISVDKKRIHLGFFADKEDAIQARIEAEIKYFGEFRRDSQIDCES